MVHHFIAARFILGRHRAGRAGGVFQLSVKEREPVLLIAQGLFQELAPFGGRVLAQKIFDPTVEFLHFFVEVLKERRIPDGQILFLTVELVEGYRLDVLGLLNGRIMLGGECRTQCRQLPQLKQGVKVHPCHHHDNEQGRQDDAPENRQTHKRSSL